VLLVDPDTDSQILAAHFLGRNDCSVVVAHDVGEALAALDQDVYDIVLVDTTLEGLQGDDAARLLRSRIARDADATQVVAISTDGSAAFRNAKTAAGFDAVVTKPFERDDLVALLHLVRRPVEA
jgi:CheY-like chemotaxis protein